MKAKSLFALTVEVIPIGARSFEQLIGANNIGLNELSWAINRAVNVRFSSEMHHGIRLMLSKYFI